MGEGRTQSRDAGRRQALLSTRHVKQSGKQGTQASRQAWLTERIKQEGARAKAAESGIHKGKRQETNKLSKQGKATQTKQVNRCQQANEDIRHHQLNNITIRNLKAIDTLLTLCIANPSMKQEHVHVAIKAIKNRLRQTSLCGTRNQHRVDHESTLNRRRTTRF